MILPFLKIIRWPNLLIIAFTQILVAVALVDGITIENVWQDSRFMALVLSTVLIAAGGYLINDYYDIKIDYINRPDRVVAGRFIKRRWILIFHTVFTSLGILAAGYVSLKIGLINFLASGLLWLYSNQLKRIPLWGNLAISFLTGLSVYMVYYYYQSSFFLIISYAAFAFFMSIIREIVKDLEDMKGDKAFNLKTLPIRYGVERTKYFIYFISAVFLAVVGFFLFKEPKFMVVFSGLAIVLLILDIGIYRADKPADYRNMSRWCKLIMVMGLSSMLLFI